MRPRNRKSLGLVYGYGFILLIIASTSIHFDSDSARPSTVHSVIVSIVEPLHRLMTDSGGELRKGLHAVSDSKGILEKNNEWGMFNPMPHFEPVVMFKNMILDEKNLSLTKA